MKNAEGSYLWLCRCEGTAGYGYSEEIDGRYHYELGPSCLARLPEEAPVPNPEVGKLKIFIVVLQSGAAPNWGSVEVDFQQCHKQHQFSDFLILISTVRYRYKIWR
jgi:hypothetical protein